MTMPAPWPAPAAPTAPRFSNRAKWIWVTAGAFLLGLAAVGAANNTPSETDGTGSFYASPGWTIQRAADLSVKIQYDDGTSSARADCAMKTIVGHLSWLEWQALGSSQLTAIDVAESGC